VFKQYSFRLVDFRCVWVKVPVVNVFDRLVGAIVVPNDILIPANSCSLRVGGVNVPLNQSVSPSHQSQLITKAQAMGDYNPGTESIFFYQTTSPVNWTGQETRTYGLAQTLDPDPEGGISSGDEHTFLGTTLADLNDLSGNLEGYGSHTSRILPVCCTAPGLGPQGKVTMALLVLGIGIWFLGRGRRRAESAARA